MFPLVAASKMSGTALLDFPITRNRLYSTESLKYHRQHDPFIVLIFDKFWLVLVKITLINFIPLCYEDSKLQDSRIIVFFANFNSAFKVL